MFDVAFWGGVIGPGNAGHESIRWPRPASAVSSVFFAPSGVAEVPSRWGGGPPSSPAGLARLNGRHIPLLAHAEWGPLLLGRCHRRSATHETYSCRTSPARRGDGGRHLDVRNCAWSSELAEHIVHMASADG